MKNIEKFVCIGGVDIQKGDLMFLRGPGKPAIVENVGYNSYRIIKEISEDKVKTYLKDGVLRVNPNDMYKNH